jgi:hypothetical protein
VIPGKIRCVTFRERLCRADTRLDRAVSPYVPDADWVSDEEAATALGISPVRVRFGPAVAGKLRRATNSSGQRGLTRDSLQAEVEWRRSASLGARVRRAIAVGLSWLVP